jgi:hypothetical protein
MKFLSSTTFFIFLLNKLIIASHDNVDNTKQFEISPKKNLRENSNIPSINYGVIPNNQIVPVFFAYPVTSLDFPSHQLNSNIPRRLGNEDKYLKKESKFDGALNELQQLKIELFGDPDKNMDFYKRNRNAYDPKLLERFQKIFHILELEDLIDFYKETSEKSHKNVKEQENVNKSNTKKSEEDKTKKVIEGNQISRSIVLRTEIKEVNDKTTKKIKNS